MLSYLIRRLLLMVVTLFGVSVAIFLLAGLAIAAIANAGIGLLVFVADDRQLRDITFWLLGSLSGATWPKAAACAHRAQRTRDRIARKGIVRAGRRLRCSDSEREQ